MTARASRFGTEPHDRMTGADLERLVVCLVEIWVGEMVRDGAIHPDAAPGEIHEFKALTTTTILTLFNSVDGLQGSLLAGTQGTAAGFIGWFLRAIS
jgi:hypothetical protein